MAKMKSKILAATCCGLVAATLSGTAWGTTGTVLFKPVAFPTETWSFPRIFSNGMLGNGKPVPMYRPIAGSDSYAVGYDGSSAKVYLIFMGPNWWDSDHNKEVAGADAIIESVKSILSSSYLSGLVQYGSSGLANYAGYWIDIYNDGSVPPWSNTNFCYPHYAINSCLSNNPMYFEAKTAIAQNPSWAPSQTTSDDARSNPIYVEIHYGTCGGGSNDSGYGPQPTDLSGYKYLSSSVNFIDISIGSVNDVDCFSTSFSHELVERMSTGGKNNWGEPPVLGGQSTTASQIADGEPNYANYNVRLSTPSSPLVTAYWSVMDQAFIVPGGYIPDGFTDKPVARILLDGFWNNQGAHVSLRQGVLSYIVPDRPYVTPIPTTVIDRQIQAYTIDVDSSGANNPNIYGLTASGQVKKYSGNPWPSYTSQVLTPAGYVASQLVAPRASRLSKPWGPIGSGLYMVANHGGATQIWQYSGSGENWTALTATDTTIYGFGALATQGTGQVDLFIMANNGPQTSVWQFSGTNWKPITGPSTTVLQIAVANNNLYMLGDNGGGNQIWVWNNRSSSWNPISSPNWPAGGLWVAGDILFTMFNNEVSQYVPGADPSTIGDRVALTGINTIVDQLVVQDGIEFYINGNNGNGYQVWEFEGIAAQGTNTTYGWVALTQPGTYQVYPGSIFLSATDVLDMNAAMNGGPEKTYHYNGSPNSWLLGP
jgi:hypothetical protein